MFRKLRSNEGFNLAEMLIVIGIVLVIFAVAFIAVWNHQRSLKQLEFDGIAKEIFVAAQNHLSEAEGQGYLGRSGTVSPEGLDARGSKEDLTRGPEPEVYYFIFGGTSNDKTTYTSPNDSRFLLNLMLPFGSIDENVRNGGSYIIRYQTDPAQILDVFYSPQTGRFSHLYLDKDGGRDGKGEYELFITEYRDVEQEGRIVSKKAERRDYNGSILGYYGGVDAVSIPKITIKKPTFEIHNEEKLYVTVTNTNYDDSVNWSVNKIQLRILVTGKTSGKSKEIPLIDGSGVVSNGLVDAGIITTTDSGKTFTVVFDDVTSRNSNFKYLFCRNNPNGNSDLGFTGGDNTSALTDEWLIPGEDIEVRVVAFSNEVFSNIAESSSKTANSLFSDGTDVDGHKADVLNFRHLENLSSEVSGIIHEPTPAMDDVYFTSATQSKDLSWTEFKTAIGNDDLSVFLTGSAAGSTGGNYYPVDPPKSMHYEGGGHRVSDVTVETAGNAGLFGTLVNGSVANLELIDFDITSSAGSAGALAGSTTEATRVSGVLAHNVTTKDDQNFEIHGRESVGGLIGETNGSIVTASAAAVYVRSDAGAAGGLIGKTTGGMINDCYSGGHTADAAYTELTTGAARLNVIGTVAGGLVGSAEETPIAYVYSTCSAKGDVAGGLVGSAVSLAVSDSYSTGLVKGTSDTAVTGAFVGSVSGSVVYADWSGNDYFGMINGALPAIGTGAGTITVAAFDSSKASYDAFIGNYFADGGVALAYDPTLIKAFGGRAGMPTLERNDPGVKTTEAYTNWPVYMKNRHYGDWPSLESGIINEVTG